MLLQSIEPALGVCSMDRRQRRLSCSSSNTVSASTMVTHHAPDGTSLTLKPDLICFPSGWAAPGDCQSRLADENKGLNLALSSQSFHSSSASKEEMTGSYHVCQCCSLGIVGSSFVNTSSLSSFWKTVEALGSYLNTPLKSLSLIPVSSRIQSIFDANRCFSRST